MSKISDPINVNPLPLLAKKKLNKAKITKKKGLLFYLRIFSILHLTPKHLWYYNSVNIKYIFLYFKAS